MVREHAPLMGPHNLIVRSYPAVARITPLGQFEALRRGRPCSKTWRGKCLTFGQPVWAQLNIFCRDVFADSFIHSQWDWKVIFVLEAGRVK